MIDGIISKHVVSFWSGEEMATSHRSRMIPTSLATEEKGSRNYANIMLFLDHGGFNDPDVEYIHVGLART